MIPGNINTDLISGADEAAYQISRSLRFNSSDSAFLSRSYSSSPTDRTKQTISFWAKFSNITSTQRLFWGYDGSSNEAGGVSFIGSQIYFSFGGSGTRAVFTTPAVFRDPSAWYHILIKVDSTTTDPVTGHRVAIFVNGVQQTTGSDTIGVNALSQFGLANSNNRIGCSHAQTDFTSAYLAEVYFIDGQALTPSSFGETNATTGQWVPKAYTGSYGTNGFRLDFSDNSAATATTLGKDRAGSNNWTPNNLAVGGAQPALYSSPNLYTNAADVIANGTPLSSGSTFSNVYVYLVTNGGGDVGSKVFTADGSGTIGTNWTWLHRIGASWTSSGGYNNSEWDLFTWGSQTVATNYIMNNSAPLHMLVSSAGSPQQVSGTIATFNSTPNSGAGNDSLVDTPTSYGTDTGAGGEVRGNYCTWNPLAYSSGLSNGNLDIAANQARGTQNVFDYQCYWEITSTGGNTDAGVQKTDGTSNTITIASGKTYGFRTGSRSVQYINITDAGSWTTWLTSANVGSTEPYFPYVTGGAGATSILNAGQRAFAATAPSGFKALCDTNLPAPVVAKPSTVMDVKLWTGNSGTQTITGLGFSPDLIWAKVRNATASNQLFDVIRGVNKALYSDSTSAEFTDTDAVTAFNSDGWTMGAEGGLNFNGNSYVAWTWDAGSSTVSNTQGSITSQVRTNGYLSIVTYTGNLSSSTVGHGLGVAPGMIIFKQRSSSVQDWRVYHSSIGAGQSARLNTTAAFANQTTDFTAVSSTTFTLGVSSATNEGSMVAYCFAPVAGYSAFGSYTGNNNADGPFQWCGFRPRWLLIKSVGYAADWIIIDAARETYNVMQKALFPNRSYFEAQASTALRVDFLSNGFKIRSTDGNAEGWNYPSNSHVWAAFAENPFQYARAR